MREMDKLGLMLCRMQGRLFEASADYCESSSGIFIRRYMNSGVAKRMDDDAAMIETAVEQDVIAEVNAEYGNKKYGNKKFAREELYWIGYIYRYWSYTRNESSQYIYKIANASEMRDLYYPYHSLDPANAIERILESKGVSLEDRFSIDFGVKVMRQVLEAANS